MTQPSIILINPWIYDFAAYDLWSKPLGLLYLAGQLRDLGYDVNVIDCLDIHHPRMPGAGSGKLPARRRYGTGKFFRADVNRPAALSNIPRAYGRYGIHPDIFIDELTRIRQPSAILVTSLMTYWYPGVEKAVRLSKAIHPHTPVILGGIYAVLCGDHAVQFSGADLVINEPGHVSGEKIIEVLQKAGVNAPGPPKEPGTSPYPAFDLLNHIDYICLLTSRGCPCRCRYCAAPLLNPRFSRRSPEEVLEEIAYWNTDFAVKDFAFYDDALLMGADDHFALLLEKILDSGLDLSFHTPNAVHATEITKDIATLMYKSGFKTIRLGLETSDSSLHERLDNKIFEGDFERAVTRLLQAGFPGTSLGAYILMGLPGQTVESVMKTLDFVEKTGASPYLAEYSPIPYTELWKEALNNSEYDLAGEPLFHNNSILPCWSQFQRREIKRLKSRVREIRRKLLDK